MYPLGHLRITAAPSGRASQAQAQAHMNKKLNVTVPRQYENRYISLLIVNIENQKYLSVILLFD